MKEFFIGTNLYWVVAQPSWFYSPLTEGLDFDSQDEKANTCTWLLSAAAFTWLRKLAARLQLWTSAPKMAAGAKALLPIPIL